MAGCLGVAGKEYKNDKAGKNTKARKRLGWRRTEDTKERRLFARNPFSPSFGTSPPLLAGRDAVLDSVGDALAAGPTHPDFTSLFIGVRGSGKTVTLNAAENLARARGWLALSENASSAGLTGRLTRAASDLLADTAPPEPRRRLSSVTAAGIGVAFETSPTPRAEPDLRAVLSHLGDALAERNTGLLITIDEMQSGDAEELREFGSVLQHVSRREQRPVAFIGAALPQIEDTLLADEAITFLQRCARHDIDRLNPQETRRAIAEPISRHGRSIDPAALDSAVAATSGYAFMIQLVGFCSWQADVSSPHITPEHIEAGIAESQRRIGRMVLAPTWNTLSDMDRSFLLAMARDEGESRLADIAERLGVTTSYASVYRSRLIRAGMIRPAGKGQVALAHHAARDWLREQAAPGDAC